MTLEDLIQELGTKIDMANAKLDALTGGVPPANVDLTPVLDAVAAVKADVEAIKLQVTPA